jgi:hypothetical protein
MEVLCLVFDFPGENHSSAGWWGGDGGFDVVYILQVSSLKSSDRLQLWRNGLGSRWRFDWCMGRDED